VEDKEEVEETVNVRPLSLYKLTIFIPASALALETLSYISEYNCPFIVVEH